jgi:hypothetical protein
MRSIVITWFGILALLVTSLYLGNARHSTDTITDSTTANSVNDSASDSRQPAAAISR